MKTKQPEKVEWEKELWNVVQDIHKKNRAIYPMMVIFIKSLLKSQADKTRDRLIHEFKELLEFKRDEWKREMDSKIRHHYKICGWEKMHQLIQDLMDVDSQDELIKLLNTKDK